MHKWCYVGGAALAVTFLATSALATVTFNLTGVGSGDPSLDNIYTSPYTGTINGGPTIPVICDDFADDSFVPEQWTAYVTSLSSLTSSVDNNLKWGTSATGTSNVVAGTAPTVGSVNSFSWNLSQTEAYDVAALLSIDIVTSGQGSTAQKDLSYALWGLFDPSGSSGAFTWLSSYSDYSDQSAAETDLKNAINQVTNAINGGTLSSLLGNYNITIYSYDPYANPNGPSCGGGPCPNSPPQEFISVTTPEASTPALLAIDLLGFLALAAFLRRRIPRNI